MKRVGLLVCLIAGFSMISSTVLAQYRQGELLLNAGVSAGVIGYGYSGARSIGIPPLTVSLEYSIDDRFAFGPYIGFFTRTFKSNDWRADQTVLGFGGRGTFHATTSLNEWLDLSIDENVLDIYASAIVGFNYYNFSVRSESTVPGIPISDSGLGFAVGPVLGARYFFSPNLAVYSELGRGAVGVFTIGVSTVF